ncbi:MAG: pilin [Patescibacteria group bacterium]|nr:pilin [Patescibacteria group bacterium]
MIKLMIIIITNLFLFGSCFAASAPSPTQSQGFRLTNPTRFLDLSAFLNNIPLVMQSFAGVIFIVMLLIGGIQYMTSGGNQQTSETAKKTLIFSLVGIIVVALSFPVVSFLQERVFKESTPQNVTATTSTTSSPTLTLTGTYTVYPDNFQGPLSANSVRLQNVYPNDYPGALPAGAIYLKQVGKFVDMAGNPTSAPSFIPTSTDIPNDQSDSSNLPVPL